MPGGESEDQRATARGEARREAGRVAPRPHRVPPCTSPTSKGEPPSRGQCDERGLREAAEPASRRHGKERGRGVQGAEARRCGVLGPRATATGGARPREHTQAAVSPPSLAAEPEERGRAHRKRDQLQPADWCRAALEPHRRSAGSPGADRAGRHVVGWTGPAPGPLARLRSAGAAGSGGPPLRWPLVSSRHRSVQTSFARLQHRGGAFPIYSNLSG